MRRHELREQVFMLLFRVEFNQADEMPEQIALYFEEHEKMTEDEKSEINAKIDAILSKKEELDKKLDEKATGWNVSRMGKVDLTILRLALYEILYDEAVPTSVAINEAVELAKKFGQDESSAFVNGILAKFAN